MAEIPFKHKISRKKVEASSFRGTIHGLVFSMFQNIPSSKMQFCTSSRVHSSRKRAILPTWFAPAICLIVYGPIHYNFFEICTENRKKNFKSNGHKWNISSKQAKEMTQKSCLLRIFPLLFHLREGFFRPIQRSCQVCLLSPSFATLFIKAGEKVQRLQRLLWWFGRVDRERPAVGPTDT